MKRTEELFRPGDIVGCKWAKGPHVLEANDNDTYPLRLSIEHWRIDAIVTAEGKEFHTDAYPSVWHWETGSPPKAGERPKWKPSKPTWCRVWNNDHTDTYIRLIVSFEKDTYKAVGGFSWDNAKPCLPEEIPSWWPEEWR